MKNDIVRCECVDMSVDGLGIARSDGLVVFVKGLIKGEEADVRIIAEKKNYSIGRIERLISPSVHRRQSDCPIAYKCGGCDFRHVDYSFQLKLKKDVLISTLKGYEIADIEKADDPYYYRNKVQIPFRDGKMGFYRKNSNDIVEFDDCLIESVLANRIIAEIRPFLKDRPDSAGIRHILIRHARATGEVMVAFIVRSFDIDLSGITDLLVRKHPEIVSVMLNLNDRDTNVILGDREKILYGRDHIIDEYDGIRIRLSLKSFYQVNYDQMLKLYAKVRELSRTDSAKKVLDLYCGIGTISLYLARFSKEVCGVEIVEEAVKDARENAKMNGLSNASFVLSDASADMSRYLKDADIVVVDPPRKGLGGKLIASFLGDPVDAIVYVSCNPATLKRDLDLLSDVYDVSTIYPFDLFPFTVHSECVVRLERKKARISSGQI